MRVKGAVASLLAATLIAVLATVTAAADTSALAAGTVAETGSLASSGLANTEGAKDDPIVIRNLQNVQGGKKWNPKKNNKKNNKKKWNKKNNKNKKKAAVKKADVKAKKEFQAAKKKWNNKKDKMNNAQKTKFKKDWNKNKKDNTKKWNKKDNKKQWKNKGKKAGNDTKKWNKQIKKFNYSGNKKISKKAKKAGKKGKKAKKAKRAKAKRAGKKGNKAKKAGNKANKVKKAGKKAKKAKKAGKKAKMSKKAKSARQKANLSRVWSKCPKFTPTSNHTCSSTLPSACAYGSYCAGANAGDACVRRKQCSCDESGKFSCVQHPNCLECLNKPTKAPTTKKAKKGSKAAKKANLSRKWAKCPNFTPTSKHSCSSTLPSCTYKGWCAGDNDGDSCVPRTECVCEDTGKFACKTKGECKPCERENKPTTFTKAPAKKAPIA